MDLGAALAELTTLVDEAATGEGTAPTALPGLLVHRYERPTTFAKLRNFGPRVSVIVRGRKVSTHRGASFSYDPTTFLLVTGEADFHGEIVEADPFLAFCFQLPAEVVAELLLALPQAEEAHPEPTPAAVGPLDAGLVGCMARLLRAERDPLEREHLAPLVVRELVFRLLRSDAAAALRRSVRGGEDAVKIAAAMRFLRDNVGRMLTVEDVARHVAMSPSHFAHRFRAIARMSPMRYVRHLRLEHARRWLVADGLRVSEAALRAGYESTSHFTRDFKRAFGASPGVYARRFRDVRITDLGTSAAVPGMPDPRVHA